MDMEVKGLFRIDVDWKRREIDFYFSIEFVLLVIMVCAVIPMMVWCS